MLRLQSDALSKFSLIKKKSRVSREELNVYSDLLFFYIIPCRKGETMYKQLLPVLSLSGIREYI